MTGGIVLRLRNDKEVGALYGVAGNPHSQNGLISLLPVDGGPGFSARFTELVGVNELSKGWLLGYASGNEPDFSPSEFPDSRVDREREFYRDNGFPLPTWRSGLVCIVASGDGQGDMSIASVYEWYADALSTLSSHCGGVVTWTPVLNNSVLSETFSDLSSEDVEMLFSRLNVRSQPAGGADEWRLRLFTLVDGAPFDSFEVNLSIERNLHAVYKYHLSINLDAELDSLEEFAIEDVTRWLRSVFVGLVKGAPVDYACICPSRAAKSAEGFYFSVDEEADSVSEFTGWMTYLSSRVEGRYLVEEEGLPSWFELTDCGHGSILEFGPGVENFSHLDANELAEFFKRSASPS